MPVFNFFHWTKEHGYLLTETGPLVAVQIAIPTALRQHFVAKGITIPAPVSGYALVDTGAFMTAVDESVFASLGVPHIDEVPTGSAHGPAMSKVYPANVTFPAMDVADMPMERVLGCNVKWNTRDGEEVMMLMGRDLLRYFLMVYNGPSSDVTLCY